VSNSKPVVIVFLLCIFVATIVGAVLLLLDRDGPGSAAANPSQASAESGRGTEAVSNGTLVPPEVPNKAQAESAGPVDGPKTEALAQALPDSAPTGRLARRRRQLVTNLAELEKRPVYSTALTVANLSVATLLDAQGRYLEASGGPITYSNQGYDGSIAVDGRVYQITYQEFPALRLLNDLQQRFSEEEKERRLQPTAGPPQGNLHSSEPPEDVLQEVRVLAQSALNSLEHQ